MVVSDGFEEVLRESMTALKLGGLVLKEEQKAVLYAVTSKKQDVYVFYRRILKPIADFNLILQGRQIFFGYGLSAFKIFLLNSRNSNASFQLLGCYQTTREDGFGHE